MRLFSRVVLECASIWHLPLRVAALKVRRLAPNLGNVAKSCSPE